MAWCSLKRILVDVDHEAFPSTCRRSGPGSAMASACCQCQGSRPRPFWSVICSALLRPDVPRRRRCVPRQAASGCRHCCLPSSITTAGSRPTSTSPTKSALSHEASDPFAVRHSLGSLAAVPTSGSKPQDMAFKREGGSAVMHDPYLEAYLNAGRSFSASLVAPGSNILPSVALSC